MHYLRVSECDSKFIQGWPDGLVDAVFACEKKNLPVSGDSLVAVNEAMVAHT